FSTSLNNPERWRSAKSWSSIQASRRASRAAGSDAVRRRGGDVVDARPQGADKGKVAIELAVVEPVAYDVVGRDLEAGVAQRQVHEPAQGPLEKRHHLQRGGLPSAKLGQNVVGCETGVDDVLDQQDVPALDRVVDVTHDPHAVLRLGTGVALEVEVVD